MHAYLPVALNHVKKSKPSSLQPKQPSAKVNVLKPTFNEPGRQTAKTYEHTCIVDGIRSSLMCVVVALSAKPNQDLPAIYSYIMPTTSARQAALQAWA